MLLLKNTDFQVEAKENSFTVIYFYKSMLPHCKSIPTCEVYILKCSDKVKKKKTIKTPKPPQTLKFII